ncbi:hypothetical protein A4A49_53049 [Nicotiana attenuata]|uniref:Uncharacterized protein n=1 Tax=Nicotiana attenuata TaxID=49451 RepID=A0A1J6KL17_NICAT|nr:hypothetical protein A4A49_64929 [Nicotiana attenuata]OIT22479.1 hypothetical protein A4A49_53049 [Nicotiana attenuata]
MFVNGHLWSDPLSSPGNLCSLVGNRSRNASMLVDVKVIPPDSSYQIDCLVVFVILLYIWHKFYYLAVYIRRNETQMYQNCQDIKDATFCICNRSMGSEFELLSNILRFAIGTKFQLETKE